jgi:hypothetical protein
MAANYVSKVSGLLPQPVRELALEADEQTGWRLIAILDDGSTAHVTFAGGISPRVWLAGHLAAEFGISLMDSVEIARILFHGHLPEEIGVDARRQPYGMPSLDSS